MSEKRSKIAAFCLKNEARQDTKIEVYPSTLWEDGKEGFYRLRQDGRWIDLDGGFPYRSADAVSLYIGEQAGLVLRQVSPAAAVPLPVRKCDPLTPCWAPYGPVDRELGIQFSSCCARVVSQNYIIGRDGRQYIAVSAPELGGTMIMAADELNFYPKEETV